MKPTQEWINGIMPIIKGTWATIKFIFWVVVVLVIFATMIIAGCFLIITMVLWLLSLGHIKIYMPITEWFMKVLDKTEAFYKFLFRHNKSFMEGL
jgi:hypothetical protein